MASALTLAGTLALSVESAPVPATTPRGGLPHSSFTRLKCYVFFSVSFVIVGPFGYPSSSAVNGFSVL